MRGLPGSGKSTKAETYKGLIVSTDNYFIEEDGFYVFKPKEIGRAHKECKRRFKLALEAEIPTIVVDNTNTQAWEYAYYVQMAQYHKYEVIIDSLYDAGLTTEQLAKRNKHGCPESHIIKMKNRWHKI